jgi:hypothetical protein
MIYTIWLIFILFNVILLLIILLNCLIAIVGESYSVVMAEKTNNIYQFRSLLNLEYVEIRGIGVFKSNFNQILLVSSIGQSTDGEQETVGMSEQLKNVAGVITHIKSQATQHQKQLSGQLMSFNENCKSQLSIVKEAVDETQTELKTIKKLLA